MTARVAPSGVSAVAGDRLATVTWKGPTAPLALPTTGYSLEQSLDDGVTWQGLPAAAPADTSLVVAGLGKTGVDTGMFQAYQKHFCASGIRSI